MLLILVRSHPSWNTIILLYTPRQRGGSRQSTELSRRHFVVSSSLGVSTWSRTSSLLVSGEELLSGTDTKTNIYRPKKTTGEALFHHSSSSLPVSFRRAKKDHHHLHSFHLAATWDHGAEQQGHNLPFWRCMKWELICDMIAIKCKHKFLTSCASGSRGGSGLYNREYRAMEQEKRPLGLGSATWAFSHEEARRKEETGVQETFI